METIPPVVSLVLKDTYLQNREPISSTFLATFSSSSYILLLLLRNPSTQHSKVLYHWGSKEEERQGNEEKEPGDSYPGWYHLTRWIDYLTRRKTQGSGIAKAGRISEIVGGLQLHSQE